MARKNVSASTVRNWAKDNGVEVGTRGRIHPNVISAFHKANKNMRYEVASDAEKRTVTVPVKVLDSLGRVQTKRVTVTTSEARDLLGHEKGRRGRFNRADLSLALEAVRLS